MHGTGKDFAGRCAGLIDQNDERQRLVGAAAIAFEIFAWEVHALVVDNQSVFGEKLIGHLHGGLQIAAQIATKVDDQLLKSLSVERSEGG